MQMFIQDIGTTIKLKLNISLDGNTELKIMYKKPSGDSGSWDAIQDAENPNALVYTVQDGIIDELGNWRLHAFVTFLDGSWHSTKATLKVTDAFK